MNTPENTFNEAAHSGVESRKKQGLEVAHSPESGSLHKSLEALHQAVSHDTPITESDLNGLRLAVESMRINIGEREMTLKDVESIGTFNTFMKETYEGWGVKKEKLPAFTPTFINPKDLNYTEKAQHPDTTAFGHYTLNPETFGLDFEKSKVFIPDLSDMEGKKLHEVFKHVVDTYGDKYYIPGIEYWKWMIENPDKSEEVAKRRNYNIKDGKVYFFSGSSLCYSSDYWYVPYAGWVGGGFNRNARWLEVGWNSRCRVLLLER